MVPVPFFQAIESQWLEIPIEFVKKEFRPSVDMMQVTYAPDTDGAHKFTTVARITAPVLVARHEGIAWTGFRLSKVRPWCAKLWVMVQRGKEGFVNKGHRAEQLHHLLRLRIGEEKLEKLALGDNVKRALCPVNLRKEESFLSNDKTKCTARCSTETKDEGFVSAQGWPDVPIFLGF